MEPKSVINMSRDKCFVSLWWSPNHPPLCCSSVGLESEKEAVLRAAELWKVGILKSFIWRKKIQIKVGEEQGGHNSQNLMNVLISVLHIDSARKLTAIMKRSWCGYVTLSKCPFTRGFCLWGESRGLINEGTAHKMNSVIKVHLYANRTVNKHTVEDIS